MSSYSTPRSFLQGRYEVIEVLGRGHYSTVYKVFDTIDEKQAALKVLNIDNHDKEIAQAMFLKEVSALTDFRHVSIAHLYNHFAEPTRNRMCIVLELVPKARTLEDAILETKADKNSSMSLRWRLEQLTKLIDVIDQAHNRSVVHRDIKLSNLLVGKRGEIEFLKLIDFGIAKIIQHYGQERGYTLKEFRTIPYAAPEQLLQNETSFQSDYYAFGVVLASLITMQVPKVTLSGDALDQFLAPLSSHITDPEAHSMLDSLIRDLLAGNPGERPRAASIKRVLQSLLTRLISKPRVGLELTFNAEEAIKRTGLKINQYFEDLNDLTVAEYQERKIEGSRETSLRLYGRSVWAFVKTDRKDAERLVLLDAGQNQPDLHRKQRESKNVRLCAYEFEVGDESAFELINEFFEYYRQNEQSRQRYKAKEDLLATSLFILDRLENQATELMLAYRIRERPEYDDILTVEVTSATASSEGGLSIKEAYDDEIIKDWIEQLDKTVLFSLRSGKKLLSLGFFRDYDPYTRELSLNTNYHRGVPPQGVIVCSNIAQLASNRRQRAAVDRFLADDSINPALGDLLLNPTLNKLAKREPRELIQKLEPQAELQNIVEKALAAEDFFLIQGPPGTGKTAIIAEIIMQIIKAEPHTRILLTSQANEAVDNALDRLREIAKNQISDLHTLRLTRTHGEQGHGEFEDSFKDWVQETLSFSRQAMDQYLPSFEQGQQALIEEALTTWQERLKLADDVKMDYAQSVQIYGVTCLRAPTLWELIKDVNFDWVIVDEAAKATDTEVLVPLVHGRKFLLVGDQRQLPPYLDTEIEKDMKIQEGIDESEARTSLFEKVFNDIPSANKATLKRQYRMHSTIGDFVGELFYGDIGGLETGVADNERSIDLSMFVPFHHRVFWLDVASGEEENAKDGNSKINRREAQLINLYLEVFNKELEAKNIKYSVGVITPYAAQVSLLEDTIIPHAKYWTHLQIKISTVDAFQGRENDITMYSLVRTTSQGMRFPADEKRLNVTFSRARRALLIFGKRESAATNKQFARAIRLLPTTNIIKEAK